MVLLKQVHGACRISFSHYYLLIDQCLALRSLYCSQTIHAQLIKVGLNGNTYLGNRCLQLYSHFGPLVDAVKVFDDIVKKNTISWNIFLKGLLGFGNLEGARQVFGEMPIRDVVSWNSMITGILVLKSSEDALTVFREMQNAGFRPSEYTFSILISLVWCTHHGKQIHGNMIRSGFSVSNVVLGNSLVDMYGKLDLIDYVFGIFYTMKNVDVITWNSLILSCHRSGFEDLALDQFCLMRTTEHSPDEFTTSIVISVCCRLQDLEKGKQIFAYCYKVRFFSNSIISSAIIDLFSTCNSLDDAVRLFEELDRWDPAPCNSMISSYMQHGFGQDALWLFVNTLRENLRPTVVTLSSVLSSVSVFMPVALGSQIHSLAVKLGFEYDAIVASSLVDMYAKVGLINHAMEIFAKMEVKDLICWNTMIMGLANNGKEIEALQIFTELIRKGPPVDRITLVGVLLACNYGGFVDEGMLIFSSMEKEYGIIPDDEHYVCVVDLLSRAGKLEEAIGVIEAMTFDPDSRIWESLLHACAIHGDLMLTERVAERVMELEPHSSLPYTVLARAYQMRGRWESMVRVGNAVKHKMVKKVKECSWVGVENHVYTCKDDQLQHPGSKYLYMLMGLLNWETEEEGFFYEQYDIGCYG